MNIKKINENNQQRPFCVDDDHQFDSFVIHEKFKDEEDNFKSCIIVKDGEEFPFLQYGQISNANNSKNIMCNPSLSPSSIISEFKSSTNGYCQINDKNRSSNSQPNPYHCFDSDFHHSLRRSKTCINEFINESTDSAFSNSSCENSDVSNHTLFSFIQNDTNMDDLPNGFWRPKRLN